MQQRMLPLPFRPLYVLTRIHFDEECFLKVIILQNGGHNNFSRPLEVVSIFMDADHAFVTSIIYHTSLPPNSEFSSSVFFRRGLAGDETSFFEKKRGF